MATRIMQAAMFETFGAPFRVASVARPVPGRGEVLVRVVASAVNPLDVKISRGEAPHARQPLPAILGIDMAGIVESAGPGVIGYRRGDEVYGMTGGVGGLQGSLAEFASVDARLLALKPATLSMREAAALPLAFITAWEGLVDRAAVKAGNKVLVQGGAGGVGHIALQIAHSFGAQVYATVSERDRTLVERLGAIAVGRDTSPEALVATHSGGAGCPMTPVLTGSTSAALQRSGDRRGCARARRSDVDERQMITAFEWRAGSLQKTAPWVGALGYWAETHGSGVNRPTRGCIHSMPRPTVARRGVPWRCLAAWRNIRQRRVWQVR